MSQFEGKFDDFGMDTISLAGPLKAKLTAMKAAGFTQVMLLARDLVGHPDGWQAAVQEVKDSGLRVTGFQVLRDFEGLSGHLHDYKVDIAKSMMEMCAALDCRVMLACSSTSTHATGDIDTKVHEWHCLRIEYPHHLLEVFDQWRGQAGGTATIAYQFSRIEELNFARTDDG
jgi:sugar phosphate isomerase/epimerase